MTGKEMTDRLVKNQIPCDADLADKLVTYLHLLREWNEKMDLTGDASDEEWTDRHLMDSLSVLRTHLIPESSRMIDVGTGAGFPGMILAIARPDLSVTLLDSQQKRLRFLEAVTNSLGLDHVTLLHARAEDAARQTELRESFDLAAARAVAPLNVLCEYLLPFVRVGGSALCWKGPALTEEQETGRRAAFLLGGRLKDPVFCPIEGRDWNHWIQPVEKRRTTPAEYPRKAGMPASHPLAARP